MHGTLILVTYIESRKSSLKLKRQCLSHEVVQTGPRNQTVFVNWLCRTEWGMLHCKIIRQVRPNQCPVRSTKCDEFYLMTGMLAL